MQQLLWERDQSHRTVARTNYSNELPPANKPRAEKGAQGKNPRGKNPQGKKPMGKKHAQGKKNTGETAHGAVTVFPASLKPGQGLPTPA